MTDEDILARINALVNEEEALRKHETPDDVERLAKLEVALDQCWDLLRQRRALREFGRDPDDATLRKSDVVENYEQ